MFCTSVDYSYEDMAEAKEWFETIPVSEAHRHKIARDNARKLLRF